MGFSVDISNGCKPYVIITFGELKTGLRTISNKIKEITIKNKIKIIRNKNLKNEKTSLI